MGECLECFPSSDLCRCFGERMSFVESNITKYLESSAFFKSEHAEVNMPAELCFDHSEVSGQGDPKKEDQSLERAAESCAEQDTPIDQSTIKLHEVDGLCIENSRINGEFSDQSGSSGYSSLLDSCSEHSESFEASGSSVDLVEMSQNDELSITFDPSDQSEFSEHDEEQLTLSEVSLSDCESFQQDDSEQIVLPEMILDDCDSFEQHNEEPLDASEMSPDLYEFVSFHQDDEEIDLSEMSLVDQDAAEQEDLSDSFQQGHVEPNPLDPLDYETLSECDAEYQEQYRECENDSSEDNLSEQNYAVELDSEDCETSKPSEPNNQNKLDEYHATHFESPELCQDSKESKPSDHCVSLVDTQLMGQMDTADDGVLPNSLDDCTCPSGSFNSLSEEHQDCNQLSEHSESSVCFEALEQCTSCGSYFKKCDAREQCPPSVPTDNSERPHQSRPTESCLESSKTHSSFFHNSEVNKENLPNRSSRTNFKKPPESDAMFSGSMETFEARWLSQFLTDLLRHNEESLSHAAENRESNKEVETPGVIDLMQEVQPLDNPRKLCRKCEELEKGVCCNEESPQHSDLHSSVDISLDAVTTTAGSSDESSEEDYGDCLDGKSQSSSETDSFKSFIDESESFDIFPDQPCDKENLLTEDDEPLIQNVQPDEVNKNCDMYSQEKLDACEEACEIDSEELTERESSKTYAEAVAFGLPTESEQIHEVENDHNLPDLMDEGFMVYYEGKDNELCLQNEEIAEDQVSGVSVVDCYGLEGIENAFVSVSGDSTGLCAGEKTFQAADSSDSPDEESTLLENLANQNLTNRSENEGSVQDLRSADEIDVNGEFCPDFENEGAHGPCCGEIETSEDEETSLFGFEDLVGCSDESDDGEVTPTNDPQLSCTIEELSNTETSTPCVSDSLDTEPKDTSELLNSPAVGGLAEQTKPNEKLEELIHQVARSEASEQEAICKSDQKKTGEQCDSYEDSESSEDEEFSEDCDCEICVPPTDQVHFS